jgi:F-box/leucine-rich repeat protein 2/20
MCVIFLTQLSVTDKGLVALTNYCKLLSEIDLYDSTAITDEGIIAVANNLPNISTLCTGATLSDRPIIELAKSCKKLRVLSIRNSQAVSSQGELLDTAADWL